MKSARPVAPLARASRERRIERTRSGVSIPDAKTSSVSRAVSAAATADADTSGEAKRLARPYAAKTTRGRQSAPAMKESRGKSVERVRTARAARKPAYAGDDVPRTLSPGL